jgi:hypothetical protein
MFHQNAILQNSEIIKTDTIHFPFGSFKKSNNDIVVNYKIIKKSNGENVINFRFSFTDEEYEIDYREFIKKLGPELKKSFWTLIDRILD